MGGEGKWVDKSGRQQKGGVGKEGEYEQELKRRKRMRKNIKTGCERRKRRSMKMRRRRRRKAVVVRNNEIKKAG